MTFHAPKHLTIFDRKPFAASKFDASRPTPEQVEWIAEHDGDVTSFVHDQCIACEQCRTIWLCDGLSEGSDLSAFDPEARERGEWICSDCADDMGGHYGRGSAEWADAVREGSV